MSNQPNRELKRSQYLDYVKNLPSEVKEVPMAIRTIIYRNCRGKNSSEVVEEFRKMVIANYSAQEQIQREHKLAENIAGYFIWSLIHQGNDYY